MFPFQVFPKLPKMKYEKLAERLQSKVETYPDEDDKLKYIRAVAHMSW